MCRVKGIEKFYRLLERGGGGTVIQVIFSSKYSIDGLGKGFRASQKPATLDVIPTPYLI